jgi:tetratricopeptide (TPR) repeat protein
MTRHRGLARVPLLLALACACSSLAPLAAQGQRAGAGPPDLKQLRQLALLPEAEQRAPAAQQQLTDWFLYRVRAYQQTVAGDAIAGLVNLGDYDAYRARMASSGGDPAWTVVFRNRGGGGPTKDPGEPFVSPNDGDLPNILDHDKGDTATCWHELQHGVLSAHNLSTRGLYGADQEHVYLEGYVQPTVAWLRDLNQTKRFERLAQDANDRALAYSRRGVEITPAIERDLWGRAAQAWRSALTGTDRITVLEENLRQEYFGIAGVRVPTVNEVIAFYQSGAMRAAGGDAIRVPIWVMCRELCLQIVSIERQPGFDPPSVPGQVRKALAFKLLATRQSKGGTTRKDPVEHGRLRVKLEGDDDQALINVSSGSQRFSGIPVPGGSSTSLFGLDVGTVQSDVGTAPSFEVLLVRAHPERLAEARTYRIDVEYSDPGNPPIYDTTSAVFLIDVMPPASLAIDGPQETPVGQEVTLTSTTGPNIPAGQAALAGTRVDWLVGGRVVHSGPQFRPDVTQPGEIQVQARLARQADVLATSGTHVLRVVAPATTASTPDDARDLRTPSPTPPVAPKTPAPTSLTLELPGYWGHLSYTITGAELDSPTGSDRGRVAGRQYKGQLLGDTLTVAGTAVSDNESSGPDSGDYYELVVSVTVGKDSRDFSYTAPKGEKLHKPFSLSIPVDLSATSASFRISLLEQNANNGEYGWVVGGSLTRDPAMKSARKTAPATAAPATPAPPTPSELAEHLRDEGRALQGAGKLTEAVAKYRESLNIESNPILEQIIVALEAAIESDREVARLNQESAALERKAAAQFRADGQRLEAAGELREAIESYRQSLTYLPDPKLEGYVNGLEAALRAAPSARPAAAAHASPSPGPPVSVAGPRVDPKQREKALRLRREGEAQEAKQKPGKALEKYRESLELLPDPALEQRVRDLGPLAEREELEKKAKRLRALGQAMEILDQPAEAAKKYRESVALIPDPDLERKAGQLEAMAAGQAREPQAPAPQDRTPPRASPPMSTGPTRSSTPAPPPQPGTAAASCSATGQWVAEGGGATFFLQQVGSRVAGRKETVSIDEQIAKEDVSGTFSGNELRLAWSMPFLSTVLDHTLQGTMSATCASMQATIRYTRRSDGFSSSVSYEVRRR